ncbi:MAG TPA: hypothetical protein VFR67_08485 [Pilimelia sp.]|nr:hypothetical protein [Pilimelia sp.]
MTRTARAQALFLSHLQPSEHPTATQVAAAIRVTLTRRGGVAGCAAGLAEEYGEHPETAAARMRWALGMVAPSAASSTVSSATAPVPALAA